MNPFAKKPSVREQLRESKREMTTATRGIEREVMTLQSEEKRLVLEIKRTAKSGNEAGTRSLAKELVRLRNQITKLQSSRAQLRGVSSHAQAMHANVAVAGALRGAGKTMAAVNAQMSPMEAARIAQDFQKQSAQMDMTQEVVGDSLDDALDDESVDAETEDLTNQVLDEIGIDTTAQMASAPKTKVAGRTRAAAAAYEPSDTDDLEQRLAKLRNG